MVILRQRLEFDSWLQETLDALGYVYLNQDGARSSDVAYAIFDRIDRGQSVWKTNFMFTRFIREVFELFLGTDSQRLSI